MKGWGHYFLSKHIFSQRIQQLSRRNFNSQVFIYKFNIGYENLKCSRHKPVNFSKRFHSPDFAVLTLFRCYLQHLSLAFARCASGFVGFLFEYIWIYLDFLLRFASPCFPATHCYLQCFPLLGGTNAFSPLFLCAKPNGAALTALLDPQGLQYSMRFAWTVHDQCENCQRGNCNECHLCAGAMHGHEQCAKTSGLLLANVELPLAFATILARLLRPNLNCKSLWVSLGLGGIMLTGSCHHSPAWKVCLWQRWHLDNGELPSFPGMENSFGFGPTLLDGQSLWVGSRTVHISLADWRPDLCGGQQEAGYWQPAQSKDHVSHLLVLADVDSPHISTSNRRIAQPWKAVASLQCSLRKESFNSLRRVMMTWLSSGVSSGSTGRSNALQFLVHVLPCQYHLSPPWTMPWFWIRTTFKWRCIPIVFAAIRFARSSPYICWRCILPY